MAYPPTPDKHGRPNTPPERKPVQLLQTPVSKEGFYTELVSREDSAYQALYPIKRGQPYAGFQGADLRIIAQYASNPLYFLREVRPGTTSGSDFGSNDLYVLWIWATQSLAQDTYNSEVTYDKDGTSYPIFKREYDVRRKDWEANPTIAPTSTLTGLLSVAIGSGGTGYTSAVATTTIGAEAQAVILNGVIIDWVVTKEGTGVVGGAAMTITGDGAGASATARIQPAGAVLVSQMKEELPSENPRSHDYVRIVRLYRTLPGPELTTTSRSVQVRGRTVQEVTQEGLTGTLPLETGNLIISSTVSQESTVIDKRVTVKVASLPPDEVWAYWDFVPLPLLLFDIVNTVFCNATQYFTLVTNPVTGGGSSVLRKHRKTVGYLSAAPNATPDLSGSTFETADIRYQGKVIQFSYGNVLNDAISYDSDFSWTGVCTWTEAYDFPATTPSATTFLAGAWYVKSYDVEPWGDSMFKFTKIEYYSAEGNPTIV